MDARLLLGIVLVAIIIALAFLIPRYYAGRKFKRSDIKAIVISSLLLVGEGFFIMLAPSNPFIFVLGISAIVFIIVYSFVIRNIERKRKKGSD